jgi:hypothetical protein
MSQLPWTCTLYGRAVEFLVACFGADWLQAEDHPLLFEEHRGQDGDFRKTHDRIVRRFWGGTWSDLEDEMDAF